MITVSMKVRVMPAMQARILQDWHTWNACIDWILCVTVGALINFGILESMPIQVAVATVVSELFHVTVANHAVTTVWKVSCICRN